MKKITLLTSCFAVMIISSYFATGIAFGESKDDSDNNAQMMFNQANQLLVNGEYESAIKIYDAILETHPGNIATLKMKGLAQSNLDEHDESLKQFFKVLQYVPDDLMSLTGMGLGFGNLGEYQESITYFQRALEEKPDSVIVNNYKEFIEKVIKKYPYLATQKPKDLESENIIPPPKWVKNFAKLWSEKQIPDNIFVKSLEYLIQKNIIQIPKNYSSEKASEPTLPLWLREDMLQWSQDLLADEKFFQNLQWMIDNGFITVSSNIIMPQKTQEQLDREFYLFEKYLRDISYNVSKEKRYIESPNPSQDVIKKFLRDYIKWNFQDLKNIADRFPNPTYEIVDEAYVIYYNIYINEQPKGLPLDHVDTLKDSFRFWEGQKLNVSGQSAKVKFDVVDSKHEANVWVTWVVRNLGQGVLGHAHAGKGIVEVTLGDYNCDGSFQLYDTKSVETIMTHELGHSVGLGHTADKNNIMYPSFAPSYAYCLLD